MRLDLKMLLPALVVGATAALSLNLLMKWVTDEADNVQFLQDRARSIGEIGLRLIELHDQSNDTLVAFRLGQREGPSRAWQDCNREIRKLVSDLEDHVQSAKGKQILKDYERAQAQLASHEERFIGAMGVGDTPDLPGDIHELAALRGHATERLRTLVNHSHEYVRYFMGEVKNRGHNLRFRLIVGSIALGCVTLIWLLQITWSVVSPLRRLTEAAELITRGDLSARAKISLHKGEIGKLASAFNQMTEQLVQTNATLELRIAQRTNALRQSQERLEMAIAASDAGLWDWNPQAKHVSYNQNWGHLLGYDVADLESEDSWFFGHIHPDDQASARAELDKHLSGAASCYESEHRMRKKSAEWVWVLDHGRIVECDAEGKVLRVMGLMRDDTNRHRAEERILTTSAELKQRTVALASVNTELQHRNEEMEQFVYTVSHDLKSPLVTMKGFVGVLKEDFLSGSFGEVRDAIQRIERAATHMSQLIEDLLRLSRAGRTCGKKETVDVSALVRELAVELDSRLDQLGVTLEIQDDLPAISADRRALSRVFENLLSNALKYGCSNPDSKITVGAQTLDDEVRFFVKDNGPGIAEEYHEKIFALFQRLDTAQKGTGVGLAIVAKIMQVHNGRVWVESSAGNGATFWLAFEASREAVPQPEICHELA